MLFYGQTLFDSVMCTGIHAQRLESFDKELAMPITATKDGVKGIFADLVEPRGHYDDAKKNPEWREVLATAMSVAVPEGQMFCVPQSSCRLGLCVFFNDREAMARFCTLSREYQRLFVSAVENTMRGMGTTEISIKVPWENGVERTLHLKRNQPLDQQYAHLNIYLLP